MTDQTEAMAEPQWPDQTPPDEGGIDWRTTMAAAQQANVQVAPTSRADHLFTLSIKPSGVPMLVVRADSAADLVARLGEAHAEGVFLQTAEAVQAWANSQPVAETIMKELGATPIATTYNPQQPTQGYAQPAPQAAPWDQPPAVPNVGQPPFGAPAGGYVPPQPQWGAPQTPAAQPGWFRVSAPFQQKEAFDAVKNQLQAQNQRAGNMKWDAASKTWLVSPAVVQYFAQWNPVPA